MNTPEAKPHLSYSQINTYLTCPLRYRFHYVDVIPPAFVASSLAFGSAIHEAVGAFYQMHLQGDSLSVDQMVDVWKQDWLDDRANVRFFNGDDDRSYLEKAENMLGAFHRSFDPSVTVLGIEEFFEVDLGKRTPPLHGYIDLIEQAQDGTVSIVDLKTSSRKPSESQIHQNVQLTAYSLAAETLGFTADSLSLRLDVLVKNKTPELVRYRTTRTSEERQRFVKLAKHVWNGVKREVWFPRQDWHCSQCPYTEPCSKW